MHSIIRYTILTAMRDKLFLGIFALALISSFISIFLGTNTLSENSLTSTVYVASSFRMSIVFGLVLFVCFHVRRSIENKEVELILTRPISKIDFVIGYFIGFSMLSLMLVALLMLFMLLLAVLGFLHISAAGLAVWGIGIYLESLVVIAFSYFVSLFVNSGLLSVILSMTFYFLSRIFGFFLISINNIVSVSKSSSTGAMMEKALDYIGILLPRLDLFSKSEWLIYGISNITITIITMLTISAVYVFLILAVTLYDFTHKEF